MSEHRDVIGLSADPNHGAVSSRSLAKTMRRLHAGVVADSISGENVVASAAAPSLEGMIDGEAKTRCRHPWNKLDVGAKWMKIREFCEAFVIANKLTDSEKALFVTVMRRALDAKLLNTKSQIDYNPELERVVTIYGLHELPRNDKGDRRFALAVRGSGPSRTTRKRKTPDQTGDPSITPV